MPARQSLAHRYTPMNYSVYAQGASPSSDRRIQRKSLSYITEEVVKGRANWVDCEDRRKGIICVERLYLGFKALAPEPVQTRLRLGPLEVRGTSLKVSLTEAGRNVQRFRARNLINRRTKKFVAIIYTQRIPATELAPVPSNN
jgi:hypothetical protein